MGWFRGTSFGGSPCFDTFRAVRLTHRFGSDRLLRQLPGPRFHHVNTILRYGEAEHRRIESRASEGQRKHSENQMYHARHQQTHVPISTFPRRAAQETEEPIWEADFPPGSFVGSLSPWNLLRKAGPLAAKKGFRQGKAIHN